MTRSIDELIALLRKNPMGAELEAADAIESLRAQLKAALDQEPAIHIREDGGIEYNPEYAGPVHGDFYAAPVPAGAVPDECCATGESCEYEVCTLNGEQQCKYCLKEHPDMKSPRITEQDAREIIDNYREYVFENGLLSSTAFKWLGDQGSNLLDKLNGGKNES